MNKLDPIAEAEAEPASKRGYSVFGEEPILSWMRSFYFETRRSYAEIRARLQTAAEAVAGSKGKLVIVVGGKEREATEADRRACQRFVDRNASARAMADYLLRTIGPRNRV